MKVVFFNTAQNFNPGKLPPLKLTVLMSALQNVNPLNCEFGNGLHLSDMIYSLSLIA